MGLQDLEAFKNMTEASDATRVDLFGNDTESRFSTDDMHNALDVAGLLPVVGNAADAFNAALYAVEGEYSNAALSLTALVPIVGQMATTNKLARESGERMITLYRGIDKWYPGQMVKNGRFISPGDYVHTSAAAKNLDSGLDPNSLWATSAKWYAELNALEKASLGQTGVLLKFEVPESWLQKNWIQTGRLTQDLDPSIVQYSHGIINGGIPKQFLTKVKNIKKVMQDGKIIAEEVTK